MTTDVRNGSQPYGVWDCKGWSPALQAGCSDGFDSHKLHFVSKSFCVDIKCRIYAAIAQSVVRLTCNQDVAGSIPVRSFCMPN